MDIVGILIYMLIILVCLFTFLANLSTKQARRWQWYICAVIAALFFFAVSVFFRLPDRYPESWTVAINLFAGIGIILPQLISQLLVRQKIEHPVFFLKKRQKLSLNRILISGVTMLLLIRMALSPDQYSFMPNGSVYDESYVLRGFSFLVFFILLIIFSIQDSIERDAICDNGFYQGGLLTNWSDFKSYSWSSTNIYEDPEVQPFLNKDTVVEVTIQQKKTFLSKDIQLFIPLVDKRSVDHLLSRQIVIAQNATQHNQTQANAA